MASKRARLAVAWLVLVIAVGLVGIRPAHEASALGTMPMRTSDPLLGPPRGDPAMVISFAQRVGAVRMADVRSYVAEIFRLAPIVGLDPAILIAQSAIEMNYWRDPYWRDHLNPGGIGIFYSGAPSFTWRNGTEAARGHIYHLYVYAAGIPGTSHVLYQYRHLTPGTNGIVSKGYAGTTHTIAQLEGRWALMARYAQGLINKGNEIMGTWKPPTPTAPPWAIAAGRASDGNDPHRAYDGNLGTTWAILGRGTPPAGGYVTFDLGAPIALASIGWAFRLSGYADHLRIRTSLDGRTFTTIKFTGNAPAKVWQSLSTSVTARYVRFHFLNPNSDPDLGYLAEVAFAGTPAKTPSPTATSIPRPTSTATATTDPGPLAELTGAKLTPVGSGGSSGVTPTSRMRDGNPTTDWRTTSSPPPQSAFVYLDLGGRGSLTGARWLLSAAGCGDTLVIAGSDDKRAWTTFASVAPSPAGTWQAASFGGTAQYVRFQFRNPGAAPALGCLAEAEVWGTGVTAAESSSPTATTTPTAIASATAAATAPPEATATETPETAPTETPVPAEPTPTITPEPTATPEPPTPTEMVLLEPSPTPPQPLEPAPPTGEESGG